MPTSSPASGESATDTRGSHLVDNGQVLALVLSGTAILLGLAIVVWPEVTVGVLAVLVGLQLIINGVFRVAQAVVNGLSPGTRTLMAVLGVLSLAIGVLALRHLFQTVTVLAVLFGVFWLVGGIIEAVAALSDEGRPGRVPQLVLACLSILAGTVVLAYPKASLVALTWLSGLWLITWGVVGVLAALWIRHAGRRTASAA
ncbi:HdeD family acid-resistance protein [Actinomadura macra]|uniref:HdeD family acid-resistance protein n=1 Tax=Actinomadura macra TaxID=46164 RepID=UPI000A61F9E4|nr:DUF308 domain-containing protein [Actinomadura macra]